MDYQIIEHQHIFPSETYFRQCHASTVCVFEPEEAGLASAPPKREALSEWVARPAVAGVCPQSSIVGRGHFCPSGEISAERMRGGVSIGEPKDGSAGLASGKSEEGTGGFTSEDYPEPSVCCAWFAGDHEKANNVAIWFSRKENGAFTPPVKVADVEGIPCWNPVLFSLQGRLWLFYKVGEEIPAWRTFVKESADGGRTWSEARELVPGDVGGRGPVKNKCLRLESGRILAPASYEREVASEIKQGMESAAEGETTSAMENAAEGEATSAMENAAEGETTSAMESTAEKAAEAVMEEVCVSFASGKEEEGCLHFTATDQWNCFVDISDDGGQTWKRSAFVPVDRSAFSGTGIIQPTLWQELKEETKHVPSAEGTSEAEDKLNGNGTGGAPGWRSVKGRAELATGTGGYRSSGRVHMLMRSSEGIIYHSFSEDEGVTWSQAERTTLPNNNSGIDVAQLADGRLVLVYNPVAGNWAARSPIAFSVSEDNGRTWSAPEYLDYVPCDRNVEWAEFSYPAIVARGQEVFLTYTWKRRTIAYWRIRFQ